MSKYSDRQIAKVLARVTGMFAATLVRAGLTHTEAATLAYEFTNKAANGNQEVIDAVDAIVVEANEEWQAEKAGQAESILHGDQPKEYQQ